MTDQKSAVGQTEKDRPRRNTAGYPQTTEVLTDRPTQPFSARRRLIGSLVSADEHCQCKRIGEEDYSAEAPSAPRGCGNGLLWLEPCCLGDENRLTIDRQ